MNLRFATGGVSVHANDGAPPIIDRALGLIGAFLHLALHPPFFDCPEHAAHLIDTGDDLSGPRLDFVGQGLDGVRAGARVHRFGHVGLLSEYFLGSQRDAHRFFGGQGKGLVHRIRMERLRPAQDRRHRLDRHAHDVVPGLLRGERASRRLGMETKHARLVRLRAETLAHDPRPESPRRAKFGDFLEKMIVHVEEKRNLASDLIDI